jgi:hypothetical protein
MRGIVRVACDVVRLGVVASILLACVAFGVRVDLEDDGY